MLEINVVMSKTPQKRGRGIKRGVAEEGRGQGYSYSKLYRVLFSQYIMYQSNRSLNIPPLENFSVDYIMLWKL